MELLKQAMENRKNAGAVVADKMPNSKATPVVHPVAPSGPDVLNRASIIEMKPKNKVVRAYFDSIVKKVVDFVDNEED